MNYPGPIMPIVSGTSSASHYSGPLPPWWFFALIPVAVWVIGVVVAWMVDMSLGTDRTLRQAFSRSLRYFGYCLTRLW